MAACCNLLSANVATDGDPAPSLRARRSFTATRWSLPALVLIVLPKCPACLAAYIALGTGLSLSMAASSYLRMALLVLCSAAIGLNVAWFVINRYAKKRLAIGGPRPLC